MNEQNKSTQLFVSILGILTAASGLAHGFFEISKGITSTENILNEMGAYTFLPNYLLAGITTSVICVLIIIFAIRFISHRSGGHIYLLLSMLSVTTGGGIAYVPFILFNWMVAQKIHSPLSWFKRRFTEGQLEGMSKIWKYALFASYALLLAGISIWIFVLPPGESVEVGMIHYLCWSMLGLGFISLIVTVLTGFAKDAHSQILAKSSSENGISHKHP